MAESRSPEQVENRHSLGAGHETAGHETAGHQSKGSSAPTKPKGAGASTGTSSDTNPQSLGMVHAILDFCAQVDPHDGATFQAFWNNLSHGATVSGSSYDQGYTLISTELSQTSKEAAKETCATGAKSVVASTRGNDHRTTGVTKRPE
ncbi:MAG TPA: hypothetical protein VGM15_10525 [Burkholderiaceae bacterium]